MQNEHLCLDWLNKQPPKSVLYISFGASTSFSSEQVKEFAIGLELNKHKFVRVFIYAYKDDLVTNKYEKSNAKLLELPKGYEEKVKDVSLVMRE